MIRKLWNFRKPIFGKIGKLIVVLLGPFVIVGILCAIIIFLHNFHKAFALPGDLKNIEYLEYSIKKSKKNLESFKILYFNDKYIFVKIFDSSGNTQIEVLKFDAFVDNANSVSE